MRSWKGQTGVQGWFFARHGEEVFSRSPLGLLASSWDWRWTSNSGKLLHKREGETYPWNIREGCFGGESSGRGLGPEPGSANTCSVAWGQCLTFRVSVSSSRNHYHSC